MWFKHLLKNKTQLSILLVFLVAFSIRLYGITTPPQYYDMVTFEAWGSHMLQVGPVHFYDNTWSDYLPLPLYFFAPVAALAQTLHLSFSLVCKSILSLLELTLIAGIIRAWHKNGTLLLLILLALSPALIGDTSFWGQVDTIPALLTALSFLTVSPVLFGLAVAIKPIMILVAPVIWIVAKKQKKWWQFPLIAAGTFLVTGLPMAGLHTFKLLWDRTLEQAGTYPYTTINAWNAWSLVPDLHSWPPDNQIILGMTLHTAGLGMFTLFTLCILYLWHRAKWEPKYAYRVGATLLIIFYTFTTRMHERHLLFGLPLLALAASVESWLLVPLFLLTCTFILNLYGAFYWVGHAQTWPFSANFISFISWINTLTAAALATLWQWPSFLERIKKIFTNNKILMGILVLASFLRITSLAFPTTYIFDEVYHAFTARQYLHNHVEAWEWWTTPPEGVAYEWTHPPVAKYGMVVGMLLFGENSFGWRIGSAVAGVISILGLYLLTKAIMHNQKIALLAAFLVSIEGLHISQSRIAMNDMYMLVFFVWALYAAVKSRWKSTAILYGLSLASKWSALYGVIPLALIYLSQNNPKNWNLKSGILHILYGLRYALIATLIYLLTFAPFILAGHTWRQFKELHKQMWYYHTHLVATHAYKSTPGQWIFAARPVWYYVNYGTNISNIYAQGNPLILWLGLAALILQMRQFRRWPHAIFGILYAIFVVPWLFSPRIMFFYHYLPSATFLCVILASWLADLSPRARFWLLILCFFGLLILSPVIYGYPTPHLYWDILFKLFPSWK